MTEKERLERLLQIAKSDLKDSYDPNVLRKWPGLGSPKVIAETRAIIARLEEQLNALAAST